RTCEGSHREHRTRTPRGRQTDLRRQSRFARSRLIDSEVVCREPTLVGAVAVCACGRCPPRPHGYFCVTMRFLLLGGTGQVGTELRALAASGDCEIVAPNPNELDLTDVRAIESVIGHGRWSAVINAAAYTNVDRAESEEATALAINGTAPSRLAVETGRHRIPLVPISTDYVFDGCKGVPYVEQDPVAPLNAYGRSKLAGERGVCAANPRHVVLRTSWVYSPYGRNFVKT